MDIGGRVTYFTPLYVIFDVKGGNTQRRWASRLLKHSWIRSYDTKFWDHYEATNTSFSGDRGTADDVPIPSSSTSISFLNPARAKRLLKMQIKGLNRGMQHVDIDHQSAEDVGHLQTPRHQPID